MFFNISLMDQNRIVLAASTHKDERKYPQWFTKWYIFKRKWILKKGRREKGFQIRIDGSTLLDPLNKKVLKYFISFATFSCEWFFGKINSRSKCFCFSVWPALHPLHSEIKMNIKHLQISINSGANDETLYECSTYVLKKEKGAKRLREGERRHVDEV